MIKFIFAVLMAATLTACAPNMYRPTQNYQVKQYRDSLKKTSSFEGSNVATKGGQVLILRAIRSSAGTTYQVYVAHAYYGRPRLYDEMYASDGIALPVTVISREVGNCQGGGCTLIENVAGDVSRTRLEKSAATGLSIQLGGRGVKERFFLPATYIQKFLSEVR